MENHVAAEYEEDGVLYCAVVTDNTSNGHFTVEVVDYGNSDKTYTLTSEEYVKGLQRLAKLTKVDQWHRAVVRHASIYLQRTSQWVDEWSVHHPANGGCNF